MKHLLKKNKQLKGGIRAEVYHLVVWKLHFFLFFLSSAWFSSLCRWKGSFVFLNYEPCCNVSISLKRFVMTYNFPFATRPIDMVEQSKSLKHSGPVQCVGFSSFNLLCTQNEHHFYWMHPQHSGYFAVTAEAAPPQTVGESMLHYVCKHCSLWVCVYNLRFEVAFAYQLRSVTNDLWHIYVSCPSIRSFAYAFLYRFSGRMNRKGRINHIVFSIVLYVWFSKQMHRREKASVRAKKKTVLFVLAKVCKYFHSLWGVKAGIFMCSFYQSANMFGIYFGIWSPLKRWIGVKPQVNVQHFMQKAFVQYTQIIHTIIYHIAAYLTLCVYIYHWVMMNIRVGRP